MAVEVVDRETGEITEEEGRDWADARLNPRFVQLRQGRPFVSYPGLLDLLHQLSEGYFAIETEVVQLPTPDNGLTAVCVARVRIFDKDDPDIVRRLTTGIGDASSSNVAAPMSVHLIRMAETRAKARALRDAVNVGVASVEELGPEEPAQAPEAPVERINVGGTIYTRPQIEAAYRQRLEQAKAAGLALGQVDVVPLERTPLSVLAGKAQEIRRRLEAKGSSGK